MPVTSRVALAEISSVFADKDSNEYLQLKSVVEKGKSSPYSIEDAFYLAITKGLTETARYMYENAMTFPGQHNVLTRLLSENNPDAVRTFIRVFAELDKEMARAAEETQTPLVASTVAVTCATPRFKTQTSINSVCLEALLDELKTLLSNDRYEAIAKLVRDSVGDKLTQGSSQEVVPIRSARP